MMSFGGHLICQFPFSFRSVSFRFPFGFLSDSFRCVPSLLLALPAHLLLSVYLTPWWAAGGGRQGGGEEERRKEER